MQIPFYKYQGTGNDFVLIDQRKSSFIKRTDVELVQQICDRKFGVGADGLILLQLHKEYDFEMIYFNSDGNESSMCGNGGRCISAFAQYLGQIEGTCRFLAIDGPHEALVKEADWVELKMGDVPEVEIGEDYYILNTGSPHYIVFAEDIDDINVVETGSAIRYSSRFRKDGINVNFVENTAEGILVATYERGVENETLSCGTGVTAAAIAHSLYKNKLGTNDIPITTKGGNLSVRFSAGAKANSFEDIWLCGKATMVFEGLYTC